MAPKGFPWERQQDVTQASNIQNLKRMHLFTLLGFILQNTELLEYSALNEWIRVPIHQFQAKETNSYFRKAAFLLLSALPSPFLQLVTHGVTHPAPGCLTAPWVPLLCNNSHFYVTFQHALLLPFSARLVYLNWAISVYFCVPSLYSFISYSCFSPFLSETGN